MKWLNVIMLLVLCIFLFNVNSMMSIGVSDNTPVERFPFIDKVGVCEDVSRLPPRMDVYGTEYVFNESGKVFLQVVDNGAFITNATCCLTVFFPNTTSKLFDDINMIPHDEGLQFVPFIVPEIEGIYMISAHCHYFHDSVFVYEEDSVDRVNLTHISGTTEGDSILLNSRRDGEFVIMQSTTTGNPRLLDIDFLWNSTNLFNVSTLSMHMLAASDRDNLEIDIQFYNWSDASFVMLGDIQEFDQLWSTSRGVESFNYMTRDISLDAVNVTGGSGMVILKLEASRSGAQTFKLYNDWLVLRSTNLQNITQTDIRGGGEIHVSQKVINAINDNQNEITEEFNMAGEFIAFMFLYLAGLTITIFSMRRTNLYLSTLMLIVTIGGFWTLNIVALAWLAIFTSFFSAFKLMGTTQTNLDNDNDSYLTNKL